MKKIFSLMLLCATVLLSSCTDDEPVIASAVSLDKNILSLVEGTTGKLTATITPDDVETKDLTWMSCNETVATVDGNGVVTAVKVGEATVTVVTRSGGKSASCVVKVTAAPIPVTGVTLDKTELSLSIDDKSPLVATIAPLDATNTNLKWTTSDAAIATVSDAGEVTAIAVGVATVTVTTEDGAKTATCIVTVADRDPFMFYGAKNRKAVYYDGQSLKPVEGTANYYVSASTMLNNDLYAIYETTSGGFALYKNGVVSTESGRIPSNAKHIKEMCGTGSSFYTRGSDQSFTDVCWKDDKVVLTAEKGTYFAAICALGNDVFIATRNSTTMHLCVYKNTTQIFDLAHTTSRTINAMEVYDGKVYLAVSAIADNKCYRYVYNGTTMVEDAVVDASYIGYFAANGGSLFTVLEVGDQSNIYKNVDWNKALPSLELPSNVEAPNVFSIIAEGNDTYVYGDCKNPATKKHECYAWKNFVKPIRMPADTIDYLVHLPK